MVFAQQKWSMGYWTGYDGDPESALDWAALTHIIHWGVVRTQSDGSLQLVCGGGNVCSQSAFISFASGVVSTAHSHGAKVVLGLANLEDDRYSGAIGNLSTYLANLEQIIDGAGYDGLDMDWESSQDWTKYHTFLAALRGHYGNTKALTGTTHGENNSFWGTETTNGDVDRVNFMNYDMEGRGHPYSWFNSALYNDACNCVLSWELDRSRIMGAGVPAAKLNMGIPFYGVINHGSKGPRQNGQSGVSQINYATIIQKGYNISNPHYDSVAHEPWISLSGSYLNFENAQSITDKVNFVKSKGLGGWTIFNVTMDYLPSQSPAHPLMAAIESAR